MRARQTREMPERTRHAAMHARLRALAFWRVHLHASTCTDVCAGRREVGVGGNDSGSRPCSLPNEKNESDVGSSSRRRLEPLPVRKRRRARARAGGRFVRCFLPPYVL